MQIFHNANYNFIRWRWHAIIASALVVVAGAAMIVMRGLPLGIDFSGGTALVVQFEQAVNEEQVRSAVSSIPGDKVVQQYGDPGDRQILIRLPQVVTAEQGTSLEQGSLQVQQALQAAGLPKFEIIRRDIVGPVIGADLQRRGIWATLASMAAITIYIGVRFRPTFAIGAIVATFHDVFVTLAFLTFFGYEMSLNVVAAILTITGYSVNDTIVIFDRVRENMRSMRTRLAGDRGQHQREPDAVADPHHRRHHVPVGAGAVPVRRRGAARVLVHDARRGHQRHLFDGVHRLGHRHHPEPEAAARRPRRRPRRPTREPGRKAKGAKAFLGAFCISVSRAPGSRSGSHRIPSHFVHGPPAAGGAGVGLSGPWRCVHRDDPARRGAGGGVAVSRQGVGSAGGAAAARGPPAGSALAVALACVPAFVAGALLADYVKTVLYYSPAVMAWAFVLGGLAMLAAERWRPRATVTALDQLTPGRATAVGACQMLALVPGVSRSGATIVGGMLLGLDRAVAAEFSFFLAMPTLAGAFVHDLLEVRDQLTPTGRPKSPSASWPRSSPRLWSFARSCDM